SPNTPLTIITDIESKIGNDGKDWSSIAFIVPSNKVAFIPSEAQFIQLCQDDNDVKQASHNLYDVLHSLDENENISAAYIYGFELNDNTEAIMNRMLKAAGNHIIKGCEL
ncbi:MAG: translation factor Sua5, partial [Staphylococcus aureus]|nr:translation factor Sua5 [Staphylococcus aureus]